MCGKYGEGLGEGTGDRKSLPLVDKSDE